MRIIGLAGYSGSGKTTLLSKAIPRLIARGLAVSTLKHAHHEFDVDQPGKDSHTHRMAGATEVLVASSRRFALMHELRGEAEPSLAALLGKLAPVDLVVIEGYKSEPHPKLDVFDRPFDMGKQRFVVMGGMTPPAPTIEQDVAHHPYVTRTIDQPGPAFVNISK